MRKWTHAHSIGVGGLAALLLATHLIWTLTAVFVAGVAVGLGWRMLGRTASKGGALVEAQLAILHERAREIRTRSRRNLERSRATRAQREAREAFAYRRGVGDGAK